MNKRKPKKPAPTRAEDPETSRKAALKVPVDQQRLLVRSFARRFPDGFIDEELERSRPDIKPNSLRTRRCELVARNYIMDSGRERCNVGGNACTVWIHRDFVPDAPPINENPKPAETKKQLRAEIERLQGILDANGIDY